MLKSLRPLIFFEKSLRPFIFFPKKSHRPLNFFEKNSAPLLFIEKCLRPPVDFDLILSLRFLRKKLSNNAHPQIGLQLLVKSSQFMSFIQGFLQIVLGQLSSKAKFKPRPKSCRLIFVGGHGYRSGRRNGPE